MVIGASAGSQPEPVNGSWEAPSWAQNRVNGAKDQKEGAAADLAFPLWPPAWHGSGKPQMKCSVRLVKTVRPTNIAYDMTQETHLLTET